MISNTNPIYLDSDAVLTTYTIPIEYANDLINLSIKVILLDIGWLYTSASSVIFKGMDIYPQKAPEPINLKISYGKDMAGLKLAIATQISRFRNGSTNSIPSRIQFHLIISAGDHLLDEFIKDSDTNNPSDFNATLLFKI